MPPELESSVDRARSAPADELKGLVREANEESLLALLENPNLAEPHVSLLLERMDLSANVLGVIAADGKWTSHEGIRLRLARHPHTPRRVALAVARQLFLFDLVRLSLLPSAPTDIRRVAEEIILKRVPHLPVGEKLTLARRGPARVAGALLAEGHPQAMKLALASAFLTESQVLKVIAKSEVPARTIAAIAHHPKWSFQYNVRLALARNAHTPVAAVQAFLCNFTQRDLREIAKLDDLAPHLKRCIQQELNRRATAAGEHAR